MAAIMNVATISRVNPAQASSKSCKASMVAKATPAKAFFGQAKALRAQSLSVRAKASKMVTKCAAADIGRSYAAALLELATATSSLEAIHADMDALEGVMDDNLMKFLNNPTMVNSRKQEILAQVAKEGQFNASTASFLQLLISKGRVSFLKEVIEEFDALYCEATDTQVATVTSAVKLENEQQFLIAKKLQEMTGAKNIKLKPQVDEKLIGGFVVQYGSDGSSFVDMSVKGQLDKIASSMVAV